MKNDNKRIDPRMGETEHLPFHAVKGSGKSIVSELYIVLIPISVSIEVIANNKGYTSIRIDDDNAEDGFYFAQAEYVLARPNLLVNAVIECDNKFVIGGEYISESSDRWRAVNENTIINDSNIADKFVFPKKIICIGSTFAYGTGTPSPMS